MDIDLDEDALDETALLVDTRQQRREIYREKAKKHDEMRSGAKPKPDWRARQAKKQRRAADREFSRGLRTLQELDQLAAPTKHDASQITNHLAAEELPGMTLRELYKQLATTVLRDDSRDSIHRVKVALTYACCSEWLARYSEDDRWSYFVPAFAPNTYASAFAAA